jgi:hypothetical protein
MERERVPKETETIAARRAVRVAEKIKKARAGLVVASAWWSNAPLEALGVTFLLGLTFYLIYPLIGTAAPPTSFSGPVIPLMAKTIEYFFGLPLSFSFQIVYLAFFVLFPFTFYLFVKRVAERKLIAALSVLFASLPIYLFAWSRVNAGFNTEDGAHIASLALVPLALLSLLGFTRRGGLKNLLLVAIFSSLVALTSPFGFFMFIILAIITTFSEMLLGRVRLKIFRFLLVFLVTAGLSSFWYNPQFTISMIVGPLGEEIRTTVTRLIPVSFFTLPVLGVFGYLLFDRKPNLQPVFLAGFYTITFALIVWAGGGFFPSSPSRYIPELGISLSFLLAIGVVKTADYIRFSKDGKFAYLREVNKRLAANGFLLLVTFLLVSGIITGQSRLTGLDRDVLGLWTGVERGEIWLAREKVATFSVISGYTTTGVTVLALWVLAARGKAGRPRTGFTQNRVRGKVRSS